MVDIETMGTSPDAPILSIGAVEFNSNGLVRGFYEECAIGSLKGSGARIDPETIAWWLKQEDAPRLKIANAKGSHIDMLRRFAAFVHDINPCGVWGNGVGFDNILLTQSFKRAKIKQPWPFWADRCYRTMKSVFPDIPLTRVGDHHNALDDAKTQALHLIEISRLRGNFL
jgi:exodeoxyribonuclease VIII